MVRDSTLRDVIVGRNARIVRCTIEHSLVGDDVEVRDRIVENMVVARDAMAEAP